VTGVFASTDDLVFLSDGQVQTDPTTGTWYTPTGSTVLPTLVPSGIAGVGPQPLADLSYTWMFTGYQSDSTNGKVFDGDIVIFHNRPFALDAVSSPLGAGTVMQAAGETVVEAVFGYGPPQGGVGGPYSLNDTSILLRWPAAMPDPDVRVGGWIADVTYERVMTTSYGNATDGPPYSTGRFSNAPYPGQRCYWYRVVKRTESTVDGIDNSYRRMVVTVAQPVRARTPVAAAAGQIQPLHVNAALVSPYVVNVYSKVFVIK
jgi:hypothetical protein